MSGGMDAAAMCHRAAHRPQGRSLPPAAGRRLARRPALGHPAGVTTVHDFTAMRLDGRPQRLADWAGRVLLVVNVASECGFTPQYRALEQLQRELGARGLVVLGFPCNQFRGQEPGTAGAIAAFCSARYGVTFPLFGKVDVNGDAAHALYRHLKAAAPGLFGTRAIKWNFTKFLVDRSGHVVRRFGPATRPQRIRPHIERLLAQGPPAASASAGSA